MSTQFFTGPRHSLFVTTRWTQIVTARDPDAPGALEALEALCRIYWPPLYAWARRQGHSPHDAQDLTQEFFVRLLGKGWLDSADPDRGRFRTLLLVAFKRFLADEWDRARAQKRGGGRTPVAFDTTVAEQSLVIAPSAEPPDQVYDRQWAMTLLERSISRLRQEFVDAGRRVEFDTMKEFLTADRGEIPYGDISVRLRTSESAARVAVHRLRKRFREVFREEIADTVAQPQDVDDELRHLLAALGR